MDPDANNILFKDVAYKSDDCLLLCKNFLQGAESLKPIIEKNCRNKSKIWYFVENASGQSGWASGKYLKEVSIKNNSNTQPPSAKLSKEIEVNKSRDTVYDEKTSKQVDASNNTLEQETIGFIIDGAGSPLGTGDKLDALRQIPYDMQVDSTSAFVPAGVSGTDKTITFSIKKTSTLASLSASGGITGTKLILGNTASANQIGFTFDGGTGGILFRELGSASSSAGATVDKNEWVFPEITGNSGDIDKLQIFIKLQPQD